MKKKIVQYGSPLLWALFFFTPLYVRLEMVHWIAKAKMDLPKVKLQRDLMVEKLEGVKVTVERLTHPARLFELSQKPEYGYLRFPHADEIHTL